MHSDVVSALENGGSIITAGRRLARALHQEFISHQRCAGKTVWKTPDILPVGAYLRQLWSDWISTGEGEKSRLLSPAQEQIVWEQIVRSSPEGESLLNIDATGGAALNAWKLNCAYRLPLSKDFEASEDCSAFLGWARRFQSVCDSNGWLDNSRLADFLANLFRAGKIAPNSRLFLGGFDEITPQLADFLNVACDWEELPPNRYEGKPACVLLRDAAEEIERSAWWARDLLNRDPDAQIGVIVPNLSGLRAGVERTFRRVLHPGVELEDRERAFHLSLGRPLSDLPVIHAALLMLELAGEGSMALPRLGVLLRSPFVGAAKTEQSERAALDARLRNRGAWNISVETLRKENTDCPHLTRVLRRGLAEVQKTPNQQRPSQWSLSFSRILKAFGWPGDRTLSSREHQTIEAWGRVLSEFASLDAVLEPVSFSAAVPRLKQLAAATLFQMENEGAPVQIMDMLEASSLS